MKRFVVYLTSCLYCFGLRAQEGFALNMPVSRNSIALEGFLLGDNHGLKSSLGASVRYDHDEKAGWGSAFLLLGLPITDSEKVVVMLGPQVGVLPHGHGEAGVRTELDIRPADAFRCGLFGEVYLTSANYSKAQVFAFVGWSF